MQKEEYALGKGSYKMLLCLSCNIPCCVTDWGTSKEIINRGKVGIAVNNDISWLKSLQYLFNNRSKLNILFPDCRKVVEEYYSTEVVIQGYNSSLTMLGGGNSGGGIAKDNTQSSNNNDDLSQASNDMDDEIPF